MMTSEARPHRRSLWALDWSNAFAADVRTGVVPYLAIYLQASRHWHPAQIGLAMSAMGLASVAEQTPAGALTDRLRQKRGMVVAAAVAIGCLWIVIRPTFAGVLSVLVVADLTRGTGRFNITNGAISTATGIGAALSNAVSGLIVQDVGHDGAFLTLAGIAAVAALWFGLAMPETQGTG